MNTGGRNTVDAFIDTFLNSSAVAWYKPLKVSFFKKNEFLSFNEMLKRDILSTSWNVKVHKTLCWVKKTEKDWVLELNSTECEEVSSMSFVDYLKMANIIAENGYNVAAFGNFGEEKRDITILWNRDRYSAREYVNGDCIDKISIPFLDNLSLYSSVESEIPIFWMECVRLWLSGQKENEVILEKSDNTSWQIQVVKTLSTIDIDISTNQETDVWRWQECQYKVASDNSLDFNRQDLELILIKNAITIPADARLVGFSRSLEGEKPSCYIIRYEHWIPDTTLSINSNESLFPEYYSNPGYINVEGDFIVLYIDSVNRKIFSMYKKWRKPSPL